MKLLGNQQSRYIHKTLDSISKNDPTTVNVVLNGFAINETKLATLAMALVNNEFVKSLYLHNTGINLRGANLLAFALRSNKTLEHLSLNDNIIGSDGCSALAAALYENNTLVSLGLSNNSITDHGAKKLCKMLKNCQEESSLTRIFLDGNNIEDKFLNKIDRYCLKVRSRSCKSSCSKSHTSTSPSSDVASITSHHDRDSASSPNEADRGDVQSKRAEYDLFKQVIGYESVNSLHTSLNASNLASYIERVHEQRKFEDELGPEYFSSDADLGRSFGTSFLSTADNKQEEMKGRKKDKQAGYFRGMKWSANRKVYTNS